MSSSPESSYCPHCRAETSYDATLCIACGMPIEMPLQQRQKLFRRKVILLALFCLVMIVWLPR